jgi:hypothetical protein
LDIYSAFRIGAQKLAHDERKYSELHKAHGIDQAHWDLLTQREYWTPDQARAIRSILASVVEVSMTIAGMPAIPLPGQYVAAVIAEVVSPCNRMIAAVKAPDTFDAADASGLMENSEVKQMKTEQMIALVLAYSGGYAKQPQSEVLPAMLSEQMEEANTRKTARKIN